MTAKSTAPFAARVPRWSILFLPGLLLAGLWVLGATGTQAQVQIDQIQSVASQIEGATQGQVVVTLPEDEDDCKPDGTAQCGNVSRSDVTGLIPGGTPSLPSSVSGNSAVVVQDGDDNSATIEQSGTGNEASISQLDGSENEATVVQEPGDGFPGKNNLAVIVQNGSMNQTTIRQFGKNNRAGIRLDGNNNGITLEQTGEGHEYLLDFEGSDLSSVGSSEAHQVSQIGSNNRLVQVGENSMPFNVRQRGDGMRMVIRHTGN